MPIVDPEHGRARTERHDSNRDPEREAAKARRVDEAESSGRAQTMRGGRCGGHCASGVISGALDSSAHIHPSLPERRPLAIEEAHATHARGRSGRARWRPDEARPQVLVVRESISPAGSKTSAAVGFTLAARRVGGVRERRDVGRERQVLARIRVRDVTEALGDRRAAHLPCAVVDGLLERRRGAGTNRSDRAGSPPRSGRARSAASAPCASAPPGCGPVTVSPASRPFSNRSSRADGVEHARGRAPSPDRCPRACRRPAGASGACARARAAPRTAPTAASAATRPPRGSSRRSSTRASSRARRASAPGSARRSSLSRISCAGGGFSFVAT